MGGPVIKIGKVGAKTVVVNLNDITAAFKAGRATGGAAKALKFGDNDLILGLNRNGSLADFKAYWGKGYGEFSSSSKNFSSQIKDAMNQSEKIRFNLDGVDTKRLSGQLNDYGEPINGYTNYELWLIKENPNYLNKTIFYQNGQIVPSPFK